VAIIVRIENPRQPDVLRLLAALDAYLTGLYPPESNHILDLDSLCATDVRFFVARDATRPLGCGALRIVDGYGEVKRMFVDPAARRRSLGRAILERIEREAQHEGLRLMRLETGIHQPEALALYRGAGYVDRGPFGEYVVDPLSVYMEKTLA
jgi:putative acetyltransferase